MSRRGSRSGETRMVLLVQGGYYVTTGAVPFFSRHLFEAVTGPKREWWLVQTVAGLVVVIGGVLLGSALRQDAPTPILGLAAGSAAVLSGVDLVQVARGRIAPTYLVDAGANVGILAALAVSRSRSGLYAPA